MSQYIDVNKVIEKLRENIEFQKEFATFREVKQTELFIEQLRKEPVAFCWISVDDALPPVEERVFLSIHRHSEYSGKDYKIVTCGIYEDGTVDVENSCWCCDSDFANYDEATDTLYIPKGWYEYHEYGDTENDGIGVIQPESCSGKIKDKVTHWMPMIPNPYVHPYVSGE